MLDSCDIMAFVATCQPEHSREFYEEVLGLRLVADEPFALVLDAHGTMLRVAKVETLTPAPHTVLGWSVIDIEATLEHLAAKGVGFERFDALGQDARGIHTFPNGTGWPGFAIPMAACSR